MKLIFLINRINILDRKFSDGEMSRIVNSLRSNKINFIKNLGIIDYNKLIILKRAENMAKEEDKVDEKEDLSELLDTFYPSCFNCKTVKCFQLHEPYSDDPNVMGDLYFGKSLFNKIHVELIRI